MATVLKFDHCGRFPFCTLQTIPKLETVSRQLKTARLDENNVVAGSLGYLAKGVICVTTRFH